MDAEFNSEVSVTTLQLHFIINQTITLSILSAVKTWNFARFVYVYLIIQREQFEFVFYLIYAVSWATLSVGQIL
jgi:hypothetical protein